MLLFEEEEAGLAAWMLNKIGSVWLHSTVVLVLTRDLTNHFHAKVQGFFLSSAMHLHQQSLQS